MRAAVPHFSSASLSAQGFVRPNNEDRVYCDDARGIYLVVDGMGGHAAGEQAATIAVERIRARLERPTDSPEQRLREAITLANNAIYEAAQTESAWKGMACVLTVAIVEADQVTVGHVGDSRLYKIRHGAIQKMTRDHSPVGEREDTGEITEIEAMQHPRRNEVYRDVGSGEHVPDDPDFVDILHLAIESDSAILLCSDGLSDALRSDEILGIVQENAPDPLSVVRSLVAGATRTGHDNVSVVFLEGAAFAKSGQHVRAFAPSGDEPEAERTDRLADSSMKASPRKSYAGGPTYFAFGTALGALAVFCVLRFVLPLSGVRQSRNVTLAAPASINQAIASASAGDTVVLGAGTYVQVVHLKDGINLVAQHRREAVIDGSVIAEDGVHCRVEGIRVRAADLGIVVQDSELTLSDDEISGAHDIGVKFLGASRGTVIGCNIHDNAGAGLAVLDTADPSIRNNLFTTNGSAPDRLRPGLLIRSSATLVVNGNIFAGNGAEAVWLPREDPSLVQLNAFSFGANVERHPLTRILGPEGNQQ